MSEQMERLYNSQKDLYESACGIIGVWMCDTEEEVDEKVNELEGNPDFSLFGVFDSTQEADEELQYQGLTLDQITKMSLNHYGNVIECIASPEGLYFVFIGAR